MLRFHAENDDAGDEAIAITVEEAVEKLEASGIEVRPVLTNPQSPLYFREPTPVVGCVFESSQVR